MPAGGIAPFARWREPERRISVDLSLDLPNPRSPREPRFQEYRELLLDALGLEGTNR
jgi:hypothetical protein